MKVEVTPSDGVGQLRMPYALTIPFFSPSLSEIPSWRLLQMLFS